MRLCVSAALVLLLGLTWTKAEPTSSPATEEGSKLHLIKDITKVLGRFHFHAGFANHKLFKALLGNTRSVWANLTRNENGLGIVQYNNMNGTCLETKSNMTTSDGTAKCETHGVRQELRLYTLSNSSMIMELNASVFDFARFRQKVRIDPEHYMDPKEKTDHGNNSQVLSGECFYLIGIDPMPKNTDLEHFLAHAKQAGFTGEPDFIQKSEQGYCTKEESIVLSEDE